MISTCPECGGYICEIFKTCICGDAAGESGLKESVAADYLEELLEFVYTWTGKDKTTRKQGLSEKALPELIGKVHCLIEEKKSKVKIRFDSDGLRDIVDMLNRKRTA